MRWYVSRQGKTEGPVEETQLAEWIRAGLADAQIQSETGGPWMPVAQSPFAGLLPRQQGSSLRLLLALGLLVAPFAFLWWTCNDYSRFNDCSKKQSAVADAVRERDLIKASQLRDVATAKCKPDELKETNAKIEELERELDTERRVARSSPEPRLGPELPKGTRRRAMPVFDPASIEAFPAERYENGFSLDGRRRFLQPGTKIEVVEGAPFLSTVKILDGPHKGSIAQIHTINLVD